jgi:hypothetical protein
VTANRSPGRVGGDFRRRARSAKSR